MECIYEKMLFLEIIAGFIRFYPCFYFLVVISDFSSFVRSYLPDLC